MLKYLCKFIILTVAIIGTSVHLTAQDDKPLTPNRLSIGGGICVTAQAFPLPLWSAFYSYALANNLELEASFQNGANAQSTPADVISRTPVNIVVPITYYKIIFRNYTTVDVSLFWVPSTSNHANTGFRIGLGGTLQNRQFGAVVPRVGAFLRNPTDTIPETYLYSYSQRYVEGVSLGCNLKIDYLFGLTQTIDVGIRAQGHFLFWYFGVNEPLRSLTDGTASIGVFGGVRF
jgi:hypothetical protein